MVKIPNYFFRSPSQFIFRHTEKTHVLHTEHSHSYDTIKELLKDKNAVQLNDVNYVRELNLHNNKITEDANKENFENLVNMYATFLDEIYENENMDMEEEPLKRYKKDHAKKHILHALIKSQIIDKKIDLHIDFLKLSDSLYTCSPFENYKYCSRVAEKLNHRIKSNKEKYKLLETVPIFFDEGRYLRLRYTKFIY